MAKNKYPIDLGKTMDMSMPEPCCTHSPKEKHYPSLYLDWEKDYDLPEEGTMTVTFKRRSMTKSTTEKGVRYSVELEIQSIDEVESDEPVKNDDRGEQLDKLKDEYEEKD